MILSIILSGVTAFFIGMGIYNIWKIIQINAFSDHLSVVLNEQYDLATQAIHDDSDWHRFFDRVDIDRSYKNLSKARPWNRDYASMIHWND